MPILNAFLNVCWWAGSLEILELQIAMVLVLKMMMMLAMVEGNLRVMVNGVVTQCRMKIWGFFWSAVEEDDDVLLKGEGPVSLAACWNATTILGRGWCWSW